MSDNGSSVWLPGSASVPRAFFWESVGQIALEDAGYGKSEISFRKIFLSEMDQLTYQLEDLGYRVWFTTEVEGVEYRLASPIKEGGGVWLTTPSSEAD